MEFPSHGQNPPPPPVAIRVKVGEAVHDGFFDAIGQLKEKKPYLTENTLPDTLDFVDDYSQIVQLCSHTDQFASVPENIVFDILSNMKPTVRDC